MSIRFREASLARQAMSAVMSPVAAPLRRRITAWLAILGLYVQLAAVGLCTIGLPVSADAAAGPFPICHAQSDDGTGGQTQHDHAPGHQDECPFCALHCHAAVAMPPSIAGLETVYFVAKPADPAPFNVPQAARFSAGTPPRGPPVSI